MEEGDFELNGLSPSKENYFNLLIYIKDYTEVNYGKEKLCRACGKRLNYINAKRSLYCHSCKIKVLEGQDAQNYGSYGPKISGKGR